MNGSTARTSALSLFDFIVMLADMFRAHDEITPVRETALKGNTKPLNSEAFHTLGRTLGRGATLVDALDLLDALDDEDLLTVEESHAVQRAYVAAFGAVDSAPVTADRRKYASEPIAQAMPACDSLYVDASRGDERCERDGKAEFDGRCGYHKAYRTDAQVIARREYVAEQREIALARKALANA